MISKSKTIDVANGSDHEIWVMCDVDRARLKDATLDLPNFIGLVNGGKYQMNREFHHTANSDGKTKMMPGETTQFEWTKESGTVFVSIYYESDKEDASNSTTENKPDKLVVICEAFSVRLGSGIIVSKHNTVRNAKSKDKWTDMDGINHFREYQPTEKLYLMNTVRIKTEVIDDDIEIIHEIHEENEGRISPSEFLPEVKAKKIDWDIPSNSSCRLPQRRLIHRIHAPRGAFLSSRQFYNLPNIPRGREGPSHGRIDKHRKTMRSTQTGSAWRQNNPLPITQTDSSWRKKIIQCSTSTDSSCRRNATFTIQLQQPSSAEKAVQTTEISEPTTHHQSRFSKNKANISPSRMLDTIKISIPVPSSPIPAPPEAISNFYSVPTPSSPIPEAISNFLNISMPSSPIPAPPEAIIPTIPIPHPLSPVRLQIIDYGIHRLQISSPSIDIRKMRRLRISSPKQESP